MCGHQHQLSRGGGTDHNGEARKTQPTTTSSTPHLFVLETASSQKGGLKWEHRLCIDFWGDYSILNTDTVKLLAFPMQGTPCHCYSIMREKNPALQATSGP